MRPGQKRDLLFMHDLLLGETLVRARHDPFGQDAVLFRVVMIESPAEGGGFYCQSRSTRNRYMRKVIAFWSYRVRCIY